MAERQIVHIQAPRAVSDGAGVRIKRLIGTPDLDHVDPFLIFDAFGSDRADDYIAGFPPHPHRGIETVTYMLAGYMRHEDNQGRSGDLGPGDVQWMTAGRGIVHSEMPRQQDGLLRGFQIWVNLPRAKKMTGPRYQDIPARDSHLHWLTSGATRLARGMNAAPKIVGLGLAAEALGAHATVAAAPLYLDIALDAGATLEVPVPEGHSAILHPYEGSARVAGQAVAEGHLAVLGDGGRIALSAEAPARLLLLAARPWREPIARYGPFVMNSREDIVQAVQDYQAGRF